MKKNYTTMDSFAQTQLGCLGAKSALYRIQWPTRLFAFLGWIGLLFAGIYYPITVGLALFGVGFLNYVLLLSFRISNNFLKSQQQQIMPSLVTCPRGRVSPFWCLSKTRTKSFTPRCARLKRSTTPNT